MVEAAGRHRAHHIGQLEGLVGIAVDGGQEAILPEFGMGNLTFKTQPIQRLQSVLRSASTD